MWIPAGSSQIIALLTAAGSGLAMAFQGTVNSAAAREIGLGAITFIVALTGTIVSGMSLLAGYGTTGFSLSRLGQVPWWAYAGGPVGPIITAAVAYSIRSAGVVNATTAIILGQLGTAALIDHMGWFGAEPIKFKLWKLAGIALVALGGKILLDP